MTAPLPATTLPMFGCSPYDASDTTVPCSWCGVDAGEPCIGLYGPVHTDRMMDGLRARKAAQQEAQR